MTSAGHDGRLAAPTRPAAPEPAVVDRRSRRPLWMLGALAVATLGATAVSLFFGAVWVPPGETLAVLLGDESAGAAYHIFWQVRLPRTVTALAVGAALGVAGLQMQTLFRNPLADPFILGASSGASLGVAIVVLTAGGSAGTFTAGLAGSGRAGIVVAAALGAGAVLAILLILARWVPSAVSLLLTGVMLASLTTALVSVLIVYADPRLTQTFMVWGMGSFSGTSTDDFSWLLPLIAGGIAIAALTVRALNALLLGERYARTMGIDIGRTRVLIIVSAALLAGVTVAFCGPIGFIGLVVPHLARMILGTGDHRLLLPGVIGVGALLAVLCGFIAQVPGSSVMLPLGAVTALIGAPVVVVVLVRNQRLGMPGGAS